MPDLIGPVRAATAFVDDPERAATWWADRLGTAPQRDGGFWWIDVDGIELGFHPSDESKNPRGASTVVYWSVADFDRSRDAFLAAGCEPHRGPLEVRAGRRVCQLTDPFGTVFGLDG